jgi:hypothetical protein
MKLLLLLPLLLGFSVPAIAHNEFNGGDAMHEAFVREHGGNPSNVCDDCIGGGASTISVPKDNEFEFERE